MKIFIMAENPTICTKTKGILNLCLAFAAHACTCGFECLYFISKQKMKGTLLNGFGDSKKNFRREIRVRELLDAGKNGSCDHF